MFKDGDRVITKDTAFGGLKDHEAYRNATGTIVGDHPSFVTGWWTVRPDIPVLDEENGTLDTWLLFDYEIELLPANAQ